MIEKPKMNKGLLYFSVADLCKNRTAERWAIKNEPTEEQRNNIETFIVNILDPAQSISGGNICIECGFVSKRLAKLLKIDKDSKLRDGCAVIISCDNPDEMYEILQELEHDELIYTTEKTNQFPIKKIFVSYNKGNNRNLSNKQTVYKY